MGLLLEINVIEELKSVSVGNVLAWVFGIFILLTLIKQVVDFFKPHTQKISRHYHLIDEHDKRLDGLRDDLSTLSCNVDNIESKLDAQIIDSRAYRKTSLSDKIFKKYQEYNKQGDITHDQLENFMLCISRYKKCLDEDDDLHSDVVLCKYLKEIQTLEVRED